jgi:hypothetical protein
MPPKIIENDIPHAVNRSWLTLKVSLSSRKVDHRWRIILLQLCKKSMTKIFIAKIKFLFIQKSYTEIPF